MAGRQKGVIARLIISILLLAGTAWLLLNRQLALDYYSLWTYQPPAEIQQMAEVTTMNEQGQFYFYASQPEIQNRAEFNESCRSVSGGETTAVLGCYSAQRIYIFNVDDPRLQGIEEVTGAHEMLHAAYDRLDPSERQRVNGWLKEQLKSVNDPVVKDLLDQYRQADEGERLNELHSIFGTQVGQLSDQLENYYSRYFQDRSKVVELSGQYESVFAQLKAQQQSLVRQLNSLAEQINSATRAYNVAAADFQNDVRAYNSNPSSEAERNRLLARQQALEAQRTAIEADKRLYNSLLKQLEELNSVSVSLNHSINSSLRPLEAVE